MSRLGPGKISSDDTTVPGTLPSVDILSKDQGGWGEDVSSATGVPLFTAGALSFIGETDAVVSHEAEENPHPQYYRWGEPEGLTLSPSTGDDPEHDITITPGRWHSDDDDPADRVEIALTEALTKRLDSTFSFGNNGGLMADPINPSDVVHVYLMKHENTGAVDALGSRSIITSTSIPYYTKKIRIGSVLYAGSAIVPFVQYGNTFLRKVPIADVNDDDPGTSAVTRTLSVPTGIVVEAIIWAAVYGYASGAARLLITALTQTDSVPTTGLTTAFQGSANGYGGTMVRVFTNTSGQIRSRINVSDGSTYVEIGTHGWVDLRGRTT